MKRAIIIVIDALGVGAMPDAHEFGDAPGANTLGNTIAVNKGLSLPNLVALGLGNVPGTGMEPAAAPLASYGLMAETSIGKDTTTGHWELAGIILDQPFDVYPDGFPADLIDAFLAATGCNGVLANKPYSGTAVIAEFDAEHRRTGNPIIYTSADSVFQIAVNTDVVPLETLYAWCQMARDLLDERAASHNVSRVIARPYAEIAGQLQRNAAGRHDYAVNPTNPTVLDHALAAGCRVTAVGKIVDIFLGAGISDAIQTSGNTDGLKCTLQALANTLHRETRSSKPVSKEPGRRSHLRQPCRYGFSLWSPP